MSIQPLSNNNNVPAFKPDELEIHWNKLYKTEIREDETIRVVRQFKYIDGRETPYDYSTITEQIRTLDQLKAYINELQAKNMDKYVSVSISSGIFEYIPNTAPTIKAFKRAQTIVLDIDSFFKKSKERYCLAPLDDDQITYATMEAWNRINNRLKDANIAFIKPTYTMMTGGGLSMILEFDREINQDEAQKLFGMLKLALTDLRWGATLNTSNGHSTVEFEVDTSFADIAHVQRAAGVVNQKYAQYSKGTFVFEKQDSELITMSHNFCEIMDDTNHPEQNKTVYKNDITLTTRAFIRARNTALEKFEVHDNLVTAKMQSSRVSIRPSELQSIEYELLLKIKESGQDILGLIPDVKVGQTTGNLTKLYCPFHEEGNPSMAFYKNDLIDVFRDFHDDTTYNLISFFQKLKGVSKTEAITELSNAAKIKLGKTERKDFQNLEITELVDELIKRVDVDNFVYYRLANKNRTCVVRHIDSGEAFIFDGPRMLATHVLSNQLNADDAEKQLIEEFVDKFQEQILIEAFEEFKPGKPTVFQKQFIKFVNLWVPSDKYKSVHQNIKENLPEEETDIYATLELLEERCPWTLKYLLQIVQKGDLHWFINWLSAVSKFEVMPTVPVVFGVQGAGKNLFVSTIMDFYLNNEYVKVLNGDRIMNNFNSVLETASLIVLDEGDFSSGKEVDQLKLLTGNNKILVEKKGIDAVNKERHFNFIFFSNGEVPVRHPAMDRRITYFKNDFSLLKSCQTWGVAIDTFVDRVRNELIDFWSIIYKTALNKDYTMTNSKNGQFWEQIMKMHPFGNLIMKLINKDWQDIALQLNENVSEPAIMQTNLTLLQTIKGQFEAEGKLSLTLINRYLQSMNYKVKTSIQYYIQANHLDEFGVGIQVDQEDVSIIINKAKVKKAIHVDNELTKAYPKILKQKDVSILEAQSQELRLDVVVSASDEKQESVSTSSFIPGLDLPAAPNIS